MRTVIRIEHYLEGKIPGMRVLESKRSPDRKALALKVTYKGKTVVVGFKSPCGAEQMLKEIRSKL